mmetsp:Transcript_21795/g.62058  ORF Transcript_21795/g.62058 Transcript_21795/m.62058 type:complete len:268 (-) Transcript_21795:161-964(-)
MRGKRSLRHEVVVAGRAGIFSLVAHVMRRLAVVRVGKAVVVVLVLVDHAGPVAGCVSHRGGSRQRWGLLGARASCRVGSGHAALVLVNVVELVVGPVVAAGKVQRGAVGPNERFVDEDRRLVRVAKTQCARDGGEDGDEGEGIVHAEPWAVPHAWRDAQVNDFAEVVRENAALFAKLGDNSEDVPERSAVLAVVEDDDAGLALALHGGPHFQDIVFVRPLPLQEVALAADDLVARVAGELAKLLGDLLHDAVVVGLDLVERGARDAV